MNTISYTEMLPNHKCPSQDAIEAISEKLPRYIREGLFEVEDFVEIFAERIHHIMLNLPENPKEKRIVEVELAYIIHNLYINHDIVIAYRPEHTELRSTELLLTKEGVLTDYLGFSEGEIDTVDISNPDLFIDFLDYLASYNPVSIKEVMVYVQTCIRISQLGGGADILMYHLKNVFSRIPMDMIDSLIDQNRGYLGGKSGDFDESIRFIQEDEGLSYREATLEFEEFQRDSAGFHFFLAGLHSEYIYPKLGGLSIQKVHEIYSALNDLHDIVDPELYIPIYFHNGNVPALLERQKMVEDGREIH